MGFSLTAASAIIGVALVISMEIIVSTTVPTVTDIQASYDNMRCRSVEKIQTNIDITNLIATENSSNHDLNFTIKNTGSITLNIDYFTVLINGKQESFICTTTYLYPQKTAEFILLNLTSEGEDARLKVVTNNGISDYYEYALP